MVKSNGIPVLFPSPIDLSVLLFVAFVKITVQAESLPYHFVPSAPHILHPLQISQCQCLPYPLRGCNLPIGPATLIQKQTGINKVIPRCFVLKKLHINILSKKEIKKLRM